MIKLRPYQIEAIEAIKEEFKNSDRQFIEMPTGSGKTVTFLSYAQQNHKSILIIVPSRELLNQVYETSLLFYHKSELSRRGAGFKESIKKVHICIVNSIRGDYLEKILENKFDLIIIDEAHHVQATSYKRLIGCIKSSPKYLGLTATPDRADGLLLKELLYKCSYKIEVEALIEANYLSDIEGYAVKTGVDISDISSRNGDFSILELYKKLSTQSRNEMILNLCENQMKDRKTIIFCVNVKHAIEVANLLSNKGLSCKAVYGDMNEKEKSSSLYAFRNDQIQFLCNCQLLTEGFDEPSIDGIVLARPTRSRALFVQMIGRGLRKFAGKINCKIIDMVDNHRNLASFNSILSDGPFKRIESFGSIKDIRNHIEKEIIDSIETKLERIDLFNRSYLDDEHILPSMEEYLEENNLKNYGTLSFDEASFLIWYNELKKGYKNACTRKS